LLPDPSLLVFVLDEHPARKTERHKIVIKQMTSPLLNLIALPPPLSFISTS